MTESVEDAKLQPKEFLRKFYPGGFYGNDRDGRPVFWEPLGQVDFWGILHCVKAEEVVKFKKEHCDDAKTLCEQQEKKLGKELMHYSTLVLDANGGGRKHLWKPGFDLFKSLVQMYDTDYPNLRKHIIVIRTPAIFPVLFSLLTPFLRQQTKDKIKVLGKDWKEKLQEYIEPQQIPVYYGGQAKDEDGDEKCEKYICYGGDIPQSLYTTEKVKQAEFKSTTIKAGRKIEIEVEIKVAETKVSYQFVTSDYDIEFSISRQNEDMREIIEPASRKQSHILMEEGEIICSKAGKYFFLFSNSYSWIRDKELFYNIKTDQENEVEVIENEAAGDVTEQLNEMDDNKAV